MGWFLYLRGGRRQYGVSELVKAVSVGACIVGRACRGEVGLCWAVFSKGVGAWVSILGVSSAHGGAGVYYVWCMCGTVYGLCIYALCLCTVFVVMQPCLCVFLLGETGVGLCVFVGVLVVQIRVCVVGLDVSVFVVCNDVLLGCACGQAALLCVCIEVLLSVVCCCCQFTYMCCVGCVSVCI